jgi:hypothetical protein
MPGLGNKPLPFASIRSARILDAELGAAPEEETTALYEAIRFRQFAPPEAINREPGRSSEMNESEAYKRYVLEERLAAGGQGEVYRGRDLLTGQLGSVMPNVARRCCSAAGSVRSS